MDQTLVLNATYEPLRVVPWQKAITLLFQGKVEVLAVHEREIRGVTVRVRLPSVLRLLRHVRLKRRYADIPTFPFRAATFSPGMNTVASTVADASPPLSSHSTT
jgi:hypothetical protein